MRIKRLQQIVGVLILCVFYSYRGLAQTDTSTAKPEMVLLPRVVHVEYSGKEFLTSSVKVLNKGAVPLIINHIKPSCLCISGVVERSTIPPLGFGKIRLNINTSNIHDSLSRVDLYIYTNQSDNPTSLPVYLTKVNPPLRDSVKTD